MTGFGEWLLSILEQILQFIVDIPLAIGDWLWQGVLALMSSSIILSLLQSAGELFSTIDPSVWYFMGIMQLPYGITAVTSAYLLRFLVRRIPFIG